MLAVLTVDTEFAGSLDCLDIVNVFVGNIQGFKASGMDQDAPAGQSLLCELDGVAQFSLKLGVALINEAKGLRLKIGVVVHPLRIGGHENNQAAVFQPGDMLGYLKAGGTFLLYNIQEIERGGWGSVCKSCDCPGVYRVDCCWIVRALPDDRFKSRGVVQIILKYRYDHASSRPFLLSSRFEHVS